MHVFCAQVIFNSKYLLKQKCFKQESWIKITHKFHVEYTFQRVLQILR